MSRLDRALTWAWGILGGVTAHPLFWTAVLAWAAASTFYAACHGHADVIVPPQINITLPERYTGP